MKRKYWLIFGLAVLAATQAAACSAKFTSCADAACLGDAGSPDQAGNAGEAGNAGADAGAGGEAGAGAGGEAGAAMGVPTLFGSCSKLSSVACQGPAMAQRLRCDGEKWVAGSTCPGKQLCDSPSGTCVDEVAECSGAEPGQVVCRADKLLTCGPDLVTAVEGAECEGACKGGTCHDPACGDGKVETGETCDDGNVVAGDGCSATCTAEPVALALGGDSTCALGFNGVVKCWGDNTHGQLGLGDALARGDGSKPLGAKLEAVSLGTGRSATQLSVTQNVACALLDNGDAKCWGSNSDGQLGTGDGVDRGAKPGDMGDSLKPIAFSAGPTVKSISAGGVHSCALLSDGSATCWGSGGLLGLGDSRVRYAPLGLPPIVLGQGRTAKIVAAGEYLNTCAVLDDGTGKCWGLGDAGELSANSSAELNPMTHFLIGDYPGEMALLAALSVGSGRTIQMLASAYLFTCALLDDGTVKCWGAGPEGECGQESNLPVGTTPATLATLPPVKLGTGRTAKALSLGYMHACALLDDGSVKCWGANEYGQLGVGNTDNKGDQSAEMGDKLLSVPLKRPALQIAAGARHSCALLDDRSVECWGLNASGQLGRGDVLNRGDSGGLAGVDLQPVDLVF